jgi:hypothetical protein
VNAVQRAMERTELARAALNDAPLTEEAFGPAEAEFLKASEDLTIAVEIALGVDVRRLIQLIS